MDGLGVLGEVFDQALAAAPEAELKVSRGMELVYLHIETDKPNAAVLDAEKRIHGFLIRGPNAAGIEMQEDQFRQGLRATRFVLNPVVRRKDRPHEIAANPSLVSINRVHVTCPTCGLTAAMFKDDVLRNSVTPDGKPARTWSPNNKMACPSGRKKTNAAGGAVCDCEAVEQRRLSNSVFAYDERRGLDPVLTSAAQVEAVLKEMWAAYQGTQELPQEATVGMPRIWAQYGHGTVPETTWRPQDAAAESLLRKARAIGRELLPYNLAAQCHKPNASISTGLLGFGIEVPAKLGWANVSDILPEDAEATKQALGFKRRLWPEGRVHGGNQCDDFVAWF